MTVEIAFAFPLPGGLHARPAARLQEEVARFRSVVTFLNRANGTSASARSVLALVATRTALGEPCVLHVQGEDEAAAGAALRKFVKKELPGLDDGPPARAGTGAPLPRVLARAEARVHRGAPASGGIFRGRAVVVGSRRAAVDEERTRTEAEELARLEAQIEEAAAAIRVRLAAAEYETEKAVLEAHLSIAEDPGLRARAAAAVVEGAAAPSAVFAAAGHFAEIFRASGSNLLAERALDLHDVAEAVAHVLSGDGAPPPAVELGEAAVVVAARLGPGQLLALPRSRVRGLVLAEGGTLSHTVVLARAFGVPCVTGVDGIERALATGDEVVVDGERGLVVVAPKGPVLRFYEAQSELLSTAARRLERFRTARAVTADGRRIEVGANVGTVEEAASAFENGAEGIGLFRTELMFLDRDEPPTEEEQLAIFAETARLAEGRPVIVRTLDVGADKPLAWLRLPSERNPALGYRAIRMYAEHAELAERQLRAILRAGAVGPLKVMFPMVGTPEEARELRALVEKVKGLLAAEGVAHDPDVPVGVMLEVPSAILSLRAIAREVDFFSVGSNDLAQYLFAVDREDTRLAHLGSPYHPAFLRLLSEAVEGAHAAGKWIGLCGELGGRPLAAPLLLGLGFDEVSVSPPRVLRAKAAFRRVRSAGARSLVAEALDLSTAGEVEALLVDRAPAARTLVDAGSVRAACGSGSRDEAIRELADLLQLTGRADVADRVEDAIWAREEVEPSLLGRGVAFPRCVSPPVRADSIAAVRLSPPLPWGDGGEKVELAILLALRPGAGEAKHRRTVEELRRSLGEAAVRRRLLEAPDDASLAALLAE
ncbi:MAG TPA: phosphoenolpyruvate--protein phosphotransferase, partial [Thermoanaerobaculia bacterium]|nr:phosphoenolpyruvate--protein phosphotransferase [Thermoanaerobaculia bacterium]